MTPDKLFLVSRNHLNNHYQLIYQIALSGCEKISEGEMQELAGKIGVQDYLLGMQFILFCRTNFLVRPPKFTDQYYRNQPNSVAAKHSKKDPFDIWSAIDKAFNEVFK